jgi:hypothetical protein
VILALDQRGRVTALEEAAPAAVALVEALRVRAVEEVHPCGEPLACRLDDQVEVRSHRAASVHAPGEAVGRERDQPVEVDAVEITAVEQLAAGRAARDVVETVGEVASPHPGHAIDGSALRDGNLRSGAIRHTFGTVS